jgi:PAS domain S-box-containing protein
VWADEPPELAVNAELLATVGRLVGLALGNVRLHGALVARQRALDESEARYRTLFEQAPDAMLIASWDGLILDANRSAAELFGHSRESLVGRAGDQLWRMTRDQRTALLAELRRDRRASTTAVGLRADGSRFRQLMNVTVTAFRGEERLLVQARDGGPAPG